MRERLFCRGCINQQKIIPIRSLHKTSWWSWQYWQLSTTSWCSQDTATALAISTNMVDIDLSVKELPSITTMDAETKVLTTDFWVFLDKMSDLRWLVSIESSAMHLTSISSHSSCWGQSDFDPILLCFMKPSVTDPRHWVLFDILSSVLSTKISLNQNNLKADWKV